MSNKNTTPATTTTTAPTKEANADKRKQSLYFPETMLQEIKEEAARLDRSLSWVVQRAWKLAKADIRQLPSVNDIEAPRSTLHPPMLRKGCGWVDVFCPGGGKLCARCNTLAKARRAHIHRQETRLSHVGMLCAPFTYRAEGRPGAHLPTAPHIGMLCAHCKRRAATKPAASVRNCRGIKRKELCLTHVASCLFGLTIRIEQSNQERKEVSHLVGPPKEVKDMLTRSHSQQVWGKEEGDILAQVADKLCEGRSKEEVRAFCLANGQSESEAYFTYIAACMIASDRVEARTKGRRVA